MRKMLAFVCLGWFAMQAQALPVVFTGAQFQTSTAAIAGGQADADAGTAPPDALPLTTSSTVFGSTFFASGSGVAANGLLETSAEVDLASGIGSAVGTSDFVGSFFAQRGLLDLRLNFLTQDFTDAGAFSGGTLFLLLVNNGVTLLNEALTAGGIIDRFVVIPVAGVSSLNLTLVSEASTTSGGSAFNLASTTFLLNTIPEPGTLLLLATALMMIGSQLGRRSCAGRAGRVQLGRRTRAR